MKQFSIFLFLILIPVAIHSQTGNPFDIGPSAPSMASDTVLAQEFVPSDNPFDLNPQRPQKAPNRPTNKIAKKNFEPSKKSSNGPSDLITLIYSILMLVALTIGINLNRRRFGTIFKSFINSNHLKNLYKDHRAWTEIQSFVLYGLFFANMTFLISLLNVKLWDNRLPSLPTILMIILLTYTVRHLVMWVVAYVYELENPLGLHNYSIGIHNMISGVVVSPFILGFGFISEGQGQFLVYVLLFLLLLIYLSRQVKGLLSGLNMRGFNLFYFFIYLCAIEIAPLLIAWKIVSRAF